MSDDQKDARTLTDADVEMVAAALEKRLSQMFYLNLGKGVWGLVWKALIVGCIIIAAGSYVKGIK